MMKILPNYFFPTEISHICLILDKTSVNVDVQTLISIPMNDLNCSQTD